MPANIKRYAFRPSISQSIIKTPNPIIIFVWGALRPSQRLKDTNTALIAKQKKHPSLAEKTILASLL